MRRCRPSCATSSANQKLDAASLIYTQAPQIIRPFDEGAVNAGIGAVLEARRSVALFTV